MPRKPYTDDQRKEVFYRKVNKTDSCWLWQGAVNNYGYGKIWNGTYLEMTHRFSWIINKGSIPKGLWVLHKCDVPACCNPEHLFLGNVVDNNRDCYHKGRSPLKKYNTIGIGVPQKLNPKLVKKVRKLRLKGLSQQTIADIVGVNQTNVSAILRGKIWKHVV